jgi:hypothetical protein
MLALRADPWTPDHGMGFEARPDEPPGRAEPFVETDDWSRPLVPEPAESGPVWFIDGVRRVDQRLIATDGDRRAYGLFGTFAVGAVRSDGRAVFADHRVERALVLGSGAQHDPVTVRVGDAELVYVSVSEPGDDPDDPLLRLQKLMQAGETDLAIRVSDEGGELVLADGRWTSQRPTAGPVVGVVKRWSREYLDPELERLVASLAPGERTPLFGLADPDQPVERYAWYVRLVPLRPLWHDRAGVVRCELRSGVGLERAVRIADRVTSLLPVFAGRPSDPRYPQNLTPVAGLEVWLQHRMGHRALVRRALQMWLTSRGG